MISPSKLKELHAAKTLPAIDNNARRFDFDPLLLIALIEKESKFHNFAFRYEPAFEKKYVARLSMAQLYKLNPCLHEGIPSMDTERCALATSWGLMQIMGLTARETGYQQRYLTKLVQPDLGVFYGCRYLKKQIIRFKDFSFNSSLPLQNLRAALSAYNAGSFTTTNEPYVEEIIAIYTQLKEYDHERNKR